MARKKVHLNHHIFIDDSTGNVKVFNCLITPGDQVPNSISLDPISKDIVTFTSNRKDTQIKYKKAVSGLEELPGSPFDDKDLPEDTVYDVSNARMLLVQKKCDFIKGGTPMTGHFVFECGRDVGGTFKPW